MLAGVAASSVGSRRFRSRYEAEKAELLQRARSAPPPGSPLQAPPLPPPVERYLEATRSLDLPRPRLAILTQRGTLRAAPDRPWMPFVSEQVYAMDPPAFVWLAEAQVKPVPLLHMLARDKFVDGAGNMLVSLLGILTVADGRGAEMDQGSALRYWGEIIAFPEAVRSPHLRWEPIPGSERQARLSIEQGALHLSARVEFDAQGLLSAVYADRYRDVNGAQVLTPWSGHMRDWKAIDGRLFPSTWESVWHLPEGDLLAVRMEILGVRTE
ncbi:MAG: DUF6544 family protein [Polyangia bacterium]